VWYGPGAACRSDDDHKGQTLIETVPEHRALRSPIVCQDIFIDCHHGLVVWLRVLGSYWEGYLHVAFVNFRTLEVLKGC
jgi:hypothetical protein